MVLVVVFVTKGSGGRAVMSSRRSSSGEGAGAVLTLVSGGRAEMSMGLLSGGSGLGDGAIGSTTPPSGGTRGFILGGGLTTSWAWIPLATKNPQIARQESRIPEVSFAAFIVRPYLAVLNP